MEYSNGNTMTRKEYLNSKKKKKNWLSKLKYVLLIVVIILLGIYVFKQLNVYNNVTKLANKVVEESKLARTMTMYYVAEPYTKEGVASVMLYKSYDESRTKIHGTENFTNITIYNDKLYGLSDSKLHAIDLVTNDRIQLTDKKVENYQVYGADIYISTADGMYKYNIDTDETKKVLDGKIIQMIISDKNIYAIMAGKTSKSIIKYSLNGKKEAELSEKYIVSGMLLAGNNIYFINSKDSKLYSVSKFGSEIKKVLDNKFADIKNVVVYNGIAYYIDKQDGNALHLYNIATKNIQRVIKKNISSIQLVDGIIYYTITGTIGINKYDIVTGKTSQITSVRTSEYVCIN